MKLQAALTFMKRAIAFALAASTISTFVRGVAYAKPEPTWKLGIVTEIEDDTVYAQTRTGDVYGFYADDVTYGKGTVLGLEMSAQSEVTDVVIVAE